MKKKGETGKTVYVQSPGLVTEKIGNNLVIYDERKHVFYQANRTAALIWQTLRAQLTVSELIPKVAAQLGGTPPGFAKDVEQCIDGMVRLKVVTKKLETGRSRR